MAILGGVEFAMLIRTGAHKLLAYRHTPVCFLLVVELTVVSSNPLSLFLHIKKNSTMGAFEINMAILGGVEFAMLIRTGAHKLLAYRHTPVCLSLVVELTVVSSNPLSLFLHIKKTPLWERLK